ncbi:uncharacterized protein [Apostichopus japonicus]|uniref:uncharacterized protein n=1 Tax=Stichopus japonicus TaxID=307972 RepID=UPI003AB21DE1
MDRNDVQRCLLRVPVISINDLEKVTNTTILVHMKGNIKEELMRRKRVLKTTEPFEIVTVKTILLDNNKEQGVTAFINEVTALKILGGQEGVPFFYGVCHQSTGADQLPSIVKGFVGELESPRYLMLSEPLKLYQSTLLPLATDADWLCVTLYISRLVENLHQHFFALGDTTEDEFALDYSKLQYQRGQLSPFLIDLGKIYPLSSDCKANSEGRDDISDDLVTFGNIITNIGSTRNVELLVTLGEMCKNDDPKKRPLMQDIIKIIEKAYALQMLEGCISQY